MLHSKKDHHFVIIFGAKTIGNVSITHKNKNSFEIHIVIGEKKYLSKGIGVVAIKKTLSAAFNKFGYTKSYLEVRPNNKRAINAYKDCGFKKDGIKRYPNNKYQPIVLKMSLSKKDFLKRDLIRKYKAWVK